MGNLLILVIIVLVVIICILSARLVTIRRSLEEISVGFNRALIEDTNLQIAVASSDKKIKKLASEINNELALLRKEQLKVIKRNTEVQTAVTNIAHDIRTPVTAISGYLELMEQEELGEKSERYVEIIRERTECLKELTEELFSYSVIDATSDELKYEKLMLNNELEVALAAAYQSFEDSGIVPQINISDVAVYRNLDKKAIQRIFGNLLSNAVRYSDGDLIVSLEKDGRIEFTNSAENMTEIETGRLFDRFYTVENARSSTGLGLSIARLLTEKMGGEITAEYKDNKLSIVLSFK